ncbi:MAG: McrB family protein, partial [Kiritimatiellia bacterium]
TWLTRNTFMMDQLRQVEYKGLPELWISLFPWFMYEHMQNRPAVSENISSPPSALELAAGQAGLSFSPGLLLMFYAALEAKPFVILTGLSGSGKTQLALAFARWITNLDSAGSSSFQKKLRSALNTSEFLENYNVVGLSEDMLELVNKRGASGKVIPLPLGVIEEWYAALKSGLIDTETDPKESRHQIGAESKYQKYIHGFYTECKKLGDILVEQDDKIGPNLGGGDFLLVSVGADLTSNENLLGYPNALESGKYCKPDNGVLDLILNAQQHPELPYFLILDEMNLSHVERYFADFLSAMESGEAIHLHEDTGEDWNGVPARLAIPKNLFVIGTVNVDETTYMFSPKVLDRANVIEFRVSEDEMSAFLENPLKPNLDAIAGQGAAYAKAFVAAAKSDVRLDEDLRKQVSAVLMTFFPALKEAGAEFGYRTAHEICRFVHFYLALSEGDGDFDAAMDAAVMQKLLPKLHGSKKKLGPVLETLLRLCLKESARPEHDPIKEELLTQENALYPVSLEKLARMRQRLAEHGFTSFAEA